MRIGVAADHGGFRLKAQLVVRLKSAGHEVVDFGALELMPGDDYPDFVIPLGQALAADTVDRGVAVCGSGVGASVCANKIDGVRACLIEDHFSAKQGVEDDNLNVICLGGRIESQRICSLETSVLQHPRRHDLLNRRSEPCPRDMLRQER